MTDLKDMTDTEKEELIAELEEHLQQLHSLVCVNPFKCIPKDMLMHTIEDDASMGRGLTQKEIDERTKELYDSVKELVDS
jgi:ribosomal protein L29